MKTRARGITDDSKGSKPQVKVQASKMVESSRAAATSSQQRSSKAKPQKENANTGAQSRTKGVEDRSSTTGRETVAVVAAAEKGGFEIYNTKGDGNCVVYSASIVLSATDGFACLTEIQALTEQKCVSYEKAAASIRKAVADLAAEDDENTRDNLGRRETIEQKGCELIQQVTRVEFVTSAEQAKVYAERESIRAFVICVEGHCLAAVRPGMPLCRLYQYFPEFPAWRVTAAELREQYRLGTQGLDLSHERPWKAHVHDRCACSACTLARQREVNHTPKAKGKKEVESKMTSEGKSPTKKELIPETRSEASSDLMPECTGPDLQEVTPKREITSGRKSAVKSAPTPQTVVKGEPTPRTRRSRKKQQMEGLTTTTHTALSTKVPDALEKLMKLKENKDKIQKCFCNETFSENVQVLTHMQHHHRTHTMTALIDQLRLVICPDCQLVYPKKRQGSKTPHQCEASKTTPVNETQSLLTKLRALVSVDEATDLTTAQKQDRIVQELRRVFEDCPSVQPEIPPAAKHADRVLHNLRKGHSAKAANAASTTALATPTEEEFRAKFPLQLDQAGFPEFGPIEFPEISKDEVNRFIDSRASLTAKGPDQSSLLQMADIAKKAKDGPDVLAKVLTILHQSQHLLDDDLRLAMSSVRSVCLTKPNGDFRPIGIGKALFRMYQGVIMARNSAVLDAALHKDNHTVRSNGLSNIIAATQRCADLGLGILLTDRSNAFNRTSVKSATAFFVEKNVKEVAHLAQVSTAHHVIHPVHGSMLTGHLPQGSSIGSAGMAAVVDNHLQPWRTDDQESRVLILTHTDDLTFICWNEQELLEIADSVNTSLSEEGIPENVDKRVIWTESSTSAVKTLGAYVGTDQQIVAPLLKAIDKVTCEIDEFATKVAGYKEEDAPIRHTAFRAIRTSYLPRLIHLMQHHPAHVTKPLLEQVDDKILEAVAKILCLTKTEVIERKHQLQLPTSRGGFGFVSLAGTVFLQRFGMLVRSLAYVTSVLNRLKCVYDSIFPELNTLVEYFQEQQLVTDPTLQSELNELLAVNNKKTVLTAEMLKSFRKLQRKLTNEYIDRQYQQWLETFPQENLDLQERLLSISARESGRPLNVATAYRPNHLTDIEFIAYARHRLLIPALESGVRCVDTHMLIDPYMDHAICCRSRGRGVMHSYVKNAVYEVARDLSRYNRQVVNMEPVIAQYLKPEVANNKNEKTIDGLKQRRGDISLESVSVLSHLKRKMDIIDVRHCSMQRPKSAADVGTTVLKGETEKHEFYDKHFAFPPGYQMIPFVIDTYGRWGNKAKEWLEKECRHVAGTDDGFYNSLISRYRETISLAHARGIGRTLERCIQNCIHPDDYPKTCSRGEGAIPA